MVWLLIANSLIFCFFLIRSNSICKSALISYILYSSITFFSANLLSLFDLYNKTLISIVWLIVAIIMCIFIKRESVSLVGLIRRVVCEYYEISTLDKCIVLLTILIGVFTTFRALFFPPQNVDSLVYHLPRAFYYYKNASIHNIPSISAWTNYSAPANAIFMAQLLTLCNGYDFLLNTIQLPAFFVGAFSAQLICKSWGGKKTTNLLCTLMFMCFPLVALQGVTTQCDLLTAGYCVIVAALMVIIIQDNQLNKLDFILLGLAGGCAIYTKITSGFTLIFAVFAFSPFVIKKYKLRSLAYLCITGILGVIINIFFWVSNFIDLNGDFLAIKISSSLSGNFFELGFRNLIGRIILNIGYIMGGRDYAFGLFLSEKCRDLYKRIGATECTDLDSYIAYNLWDNHDIQPFGIYFYFTIIALVLTIFLRKRLNIRLKAYIYISTAALFFSALFLTTQYSAYVQSAPRYLLPAAVICIPNICIIISNLFQKYDIYAICKTQSIVAILLILIMSEGLHVSFFDLRQPLPVWKRFAGASYEELRDYPYYRKGWADAKKLYLNKIEEHSITKIGIWEKDLSGIYPLLNVLKEQKYEVKSIFGTYANQYGDISFEPEAIIYVGNRAELPETLTYLGRVFYKYSSGSELTWNNASSCFYILNSKVGAYE